MCGAGSMPFFLRPHTCRAGNLAVVATHNALTREASPKSRTNRINKGAWMGTRFFMMRLKHTLPHTSMYRVSTTNQWRRNAVGKFERLPPRFLYVEEEKDTFLCDSRRASSNIARCVHSAVSCLSRTAAFALSSSRLRPYGPLSLWQADNHAETKRFLRGVAEDIRMLSENKRPLGSKTKKVPQAPRGYTFYTETGQEPQKGTRYKLLLHNTNLGE